MSKKISHFIGLGCFVIVLVFFFWPVWVLRALLIYQYMDWNWARVCLFSQISEFVECGGRLLTDKTLQLDDDDNEKCYNMNINILRQKNQILHSNTEVQHGSTSTTRKHLHSKSRIAHIHIDIYTITIFALRTFSFTRIYVSVLNLNLTIITR